MLSENVIIERRGFKVIEQEGPFPALTQICPLLETYFVYSLVKYCFGTM